MIAAEFGTGQVLWSIFWFSVFALWVYFVLVIFGDILRNDDLSGALKAGWALAIIVVPYLGVLAYLVAHGDEMSLRFLERRQSSRRDPAWGQIAAVQGDQSLAGRAATLSRLHEEGQLTDAELEAAKRDLL